jgi:hypothetical protein
MCFEVRSQLLGLSVKSVRVHNACVVELLRSVSLSDRTVDEAEEYFADPADVLIALTVAINRLRLENVVTC